MTSIINSRELYLIRQMGVIDVLLSVS